MGLFDDIPIEQSGASFSDVPMQERLNAVEPANWLERQLAQITLPKQAEWGLNRARGFAMGMADPSVGAVQLAANVTGYGKPVNKAIQQKEAEYEADRMAVTDPSISSLITGQKDPGFDWARMSGNVASPVNLLAAKIPFAATTGKRIAQGAAMGGAAGAMQPVVDGTDSFGSQKASQIGFGAVSGGALAPVLGKLGEMVMRRISAPTAAANASIETDRILREAMDEIGTSINDLPPQAIATLRAQVLNALKTGKKLDPAAMLRSEDFKSVGIKPLLGQITRDPMQYARELNLRGVSGVGEPIAARLAEQNRAIQQGVGALRNGAIDDMPLAGEQLSGALKKADDSIRSHVSGLYSAARQSAGKDLDVPLQGLAQDVADVLDRFGKLPDGVMNQLRKIGLDPATPGNQKQIFTIESADKLLKSINENDPGAFKDKVTHTALGVLRDSVKNSVTAVDATGGPFAPAVAAAAKRFKMHEVVPSLRAAAEGSVAPDDFVRRFVINGKANELHGMAKVLKASDPAAYDQARAQIGAHLNRSAFGENVTADKPFSAERFNKALREIGDSRLGAFFTPDEVAKLKVLGRVGAYIHQAPSASVPNYSGTASALMNLSNRIPGAPAVVSLANAAKTSVDNANVVRRSVAAVPPVTRAGLSPADMKRLSDILSVGAFGAGTVGGSFGRR